MRRHSELPSLGDVGSLLREYDRVRAIRAIRGNADCPGDEHRANHHDLYAGLHRFVLLVRNAAAILSAGHVQLPQPHQAGRRKGFLSDRRSHEAPVGQCASFLGESGLSPAGRRRGRSLVRSGAPVIRVVLGEDSFLAREGIARVLDSIEDVDLVASCGDLDELRSTVDEVRPDVVLTDIRMPPTNTDEGIRFAGELRRSLPEDKDELERALREVADGRSLVDPRIVDKLVSARLSDPGIEKLTSREREILALIAEGRSNTSIAELLQVTKRAVERHINGIFVKLELPEDGDVNRRVKATLLYLTGDGA
jgi:DNA-binding NarL/FixJ family response regulator